MLLGPDFDGDFIHPRISFTQGMGEVEPGDKGKIKIILYAKVDG